MNEGDPEPGAEPPRTRQQREEFWSLVIITAMILVVVFIARIA